VSGFGSDIGGGPDDGSSTAAVGYIYRCKRRRGAGCSEPGGFLSKLSIACKEARETHYWLRLLAASEVVEDARLIELLDEADQLIAILTTITKNTRRNLE